MIPTIDHKEEVRPGKSIIQTTLGGVNVFAFNVKPGDVQTWDRGEGNQGKNGQFNERAEISYAPAPDSEKYKSPNNAQEGVTKAYLVDYAFEPGWPDHDPAQHNWAVLTQFHPQPNPKGIPGFGGATVANREIRYNRPDGSGVPFASIPITDDRRLIKTRMEVKWDSSPSGFVRIYSQDALVGSYVGPTIAPGEFKYLKQGYYRSGGLPEGTVYQTQVDVQEIAMPTPAPTPAPTPQVSGSYSPSPADQAVLKQALAALISLPPQIATLQGILTKIQNDVRAVLDKGETPWPR